MSLNDSSAVILLIGALAVLAFVIHGLWFSGNSVNRKLNKGSKEDQEIIKSQGVGKVRIVSSELSNGAENEIETFDSASIQKKPAPAVKKPVKENTGESVIEISDGSSQAAPIDDIYELNVMAEQDKPYGGEDLKEICDHYGFLRGEGDLFYVYEDESRQKVVFRICSLTRPYNFPKDMAGFHTDSLAVYMKLPERGKAYSYFSAMRMAAEIFVDRLGGKIKDNNYNLLTKEDLDAMSAKLRQYDQGV